MSSTQTRKTDSKKIKVLLVDDVELFIELEKTFFRREDFQILTAVNGAGALELVRREKPDLVFLDLCLEDLNGDEICRRLKLNVETADIPVIMVVQHGNEEEITACRAAGCDEILFKPVRREEFLRASRDQLSLTERSAPRIETRVLVSYGLREERLLQQYTANLGVGGLFLATDALLQIDTRLHLQVEIPDGHPPITCLGRVAWLNHPDWLKKPQLPHGMGIQFLNLDDSQRRRLNLHLASC